MWPALAYGLQNLMSASADDGVNVVKEEPQVGAPEDVNIPGLDGKMPTAEQLLEMLDSMSGISEEDKASLKDDLLKNFQDRAAQAQAAMPSNDLTTQTIILLSLLAVVALIFVFFVYKLFRCLSEREAKREEKKKNKQLKKKK